MISERPWLYASTLASDFRKIFVTYSDSFRNNIKACFNNWKEQIDPDMEDQLYKHIFIEKKTTDHHWAFAINLNRYRCTPSILHLNEISLRHYK